MAARLRLTSADEAAVSLNCPSSVAISTSTEIPLAASNCPPPASTSAAGPTLDPCRSSPACEGTRISETPGSALLCDVDLGALELARVVDVDRLPLGEDVEGGLAGLAM